MYKILSGEDIVKYSDTFKRLEKFKSNLNDAECIVLEDKSEKIGYISAWKKEKSYLIENIFIREEKYYLVYIQDILIISLSFVVYFVVKEKNYNKTIRSLMTPFKYLIFLYSI